MKDGSVLMYLNLVIYNIEISAQIEICIWEKLTRWPRSKPKRRKAKW